MILTDATVTELESNGKTVTGVAYHRPDGAIERVTCDAVILACSGFAGNTEMVARYIPDMAAATFHGHPGNKGDAIRWGEQLGAKLADLTGYQGHGGLAAGLVAIAACAALAERGMGPPPRFLVLSLTSHASPTRGPVPADSDEALAQERGLLAAASAHRRTPRKGWRAGRCRGV